jgi:hypothetical protein
MIYVPCTEINPAPSITGPRALFEKSKVWTRGSSGTVYVTFGPPCSGRQCQAFAYTGNNAMSPGRPNMHLGFIDPPLTSFTFNGKTYTNSDFGNAFRNYCSEPSRGPVTCPPDWVPGTTVIHEFCHILGMNHEHQNNLFNSNTIVLNEQAIIADYEADKMTAADAINNVIDRYTCPQDNGSGSSRCNYIGSGFDPKSIMLYMLPNEWLKPGPNAKPGEPLINPTRSNYVLSELDKQWLMQMYPKSSDQWPFMNIVFVDGPIWKQAWTTKVASEQLFPMLGIRTRFTFTDGTVFNFPATSATPTTPAAPTTPATTRPPTAPTAPATTRPPVNPVNACGPVRCSGPTRACTNIKRDGAIATGTCKSNCRQNCPDRVVGPSKPLVTTSGCTIECSFIPGTCVKPIKNTSTGVAALCDTTCKQDCTVRSEKFANHGPVLGSTNGLSGHAIAIIVLVILAILLAMIMAHKYI